MRTNIAKAHRPARATSIRALRADAFTLVEVLVVIFILGVVAAIVAGVAGYVMKSAATRETLATEQVLMQAIQAYHDAYTPPAYPPDHDGSSDPNASGTWLVHYLTGKFADGNDKSQAPAAKAATDVLLKLPRDSWTGDSNSAVKDSWGHDMHYDASGGLGGKPVIISGGPDGTFGDPSNAGDPKGEDNIRSDESQ